MELITMAERDRLLANGSAGDEAAFEGLTPVTKLFSPDAGLTWLLVAMDRADHDRAWGLIDAADGAPRLGWDSLQRIGSLRGRLGRPVERDEHFDPVADVATYATEAARIGIVIA